MLDKSNGSFFLTAEKIFIIIVLKKDYYGGDMRNIDEKTKAFCDAWQSISVIYEDYARKVGVSYNTLYILNAILRTENCTQKQICEKTLLPKQTVNNVVTSFYKSGYVELREMPKNRRIKTIHLTEKGKQYADELIPHIHQADSKAMSALTEQQQDTLLELMQIYVSAFRKEMIGD
jgi:MarR family transcriptional regulator, organic hydroperoxide resistance regulator